MGKKTDDSAERRMAAAAKKDAAAPQYDGPVENIDEQPPVGNVNTDVLREAFPFEIEAEAEGEKQEGMTSFGVDVDVYNKIAATRSYSEMKRVCMSLNVDEATGLAIKDWVAVHGDDELPVG